MSNDQQRILDLIAARVDADHEAKLVSNIEVANNNYNLSIGTYIDAASSTDIVDIAALNAEIASIVRVQADLRERVDAIVAELEARG